MPGGSDRFLSVYLPGNIVSPGEPSTIQLAIVDDAQIESGKRAIVRNYRDANASDAGRAHAYVCDGPSDRQGRCSS